MEFTKDEQVCAQPKMREAILSDAIKAVCTDRNAQYGEPEDNFKVIAELWNNYLRYSKNSVTQLTGYDVGMLMTLFKVGRAMTGSPKLDTFVDAAGYLACAGEIVMRSTPGREA